jgi:hypothetical protein
MTMPIGPYMNEDGDWWVPVESASFKQARAEIVSHLQYSIPEGGTLIYRGKEMAWLGGEDTYDRDNQEYVLAWHFEEGGQR